MFSASGCMERRCTSRPPAIRTSTSGQTNRTIARIRRQRCGVRFHSFASGVPSKGMRKLTGTESESSSRSAYTTSTRSSSVSPMPAIRPEQADRPAACAFCTVSTRSAYVWVLVMPPYVASDVFRLWLYASAPAVPQPLRLAVRQQTEAGAHLDALVLLLDRLDGPADPLDVPVRRTAPARHQADPLGPARDTRRGGLGRLVRLQPRVLEDLGLGAEPLRTVRAVLRAQPRLQVDEVVELHPPPEPLTAHLARRRHHIEQLVVGGRQNGERFFTGRQLAPQPLLHQRVQQVHKR